MIKTKIRKLFDVIINSKPYGVYDIQDKEHAGYNDTPKTWWLYYAKPVNEIADGIDLPIDSESWVPYSVSLLRRTWDIRFKQGTTSKVKWGDVQFSNYTKVEMWCNEKLIYSFSTLGTALDFAMAKVQYLQVILSEHPYDFFNPEEMQGRQIWWKGLPATVRVRENETWNISIVPDYTIMPEKEWWSELSRREEKIGRKKDQDWEIENEYDQETRDYGEINWGDALSDQHIDWFREMHS